MPSDLNQRNSEFSFIAEIFVNDKPTTPMTDALEKLPFLMQRTIDCLRRNAVSYLMFSETQDIEVGARLFKELFPRTRTGMSESLKLASENMREPYSHDDRIFLDGLYSKAIRTESMSTQKAEEAEIILNELKNSNAVKSLSLKCLTGLSDNNIQQLCTAIKENLSIAKVDVDKCSPSLVAAIKKVAEDRAPDHPLELNVMNELIEEAEKPAQQDAGFFSNIDCWLVIDGFIVVVGLATIALAFITFEAVTLNPIGLAVGVAGGLMLAKGLYGLFGKSESQVADNQSISLQP